MEITDSKSYKIQLLRGAAIIAVVAIHNSPAGMEQIFIRPFFNFAVGMFLFLSGLLSSAERWKPWKRIRKVLIPYLIWTMIYVILKNLYTPVRIPLSYVKMVIAGNAAPVMYYVFVYCELTLLIPLIDKLARSRFKYLGFLITPLEIVIMYLIPLIAGIQLNEYVLMIREISCLGWFTYFYLGYLIGNDLILVKLTNLKLAFLWCVGIVLQVVESIWLYLMGDVNPCTQLKLSAVFTGVFFVLLAYRFINSEKDFKLKWLHLLGDHSFGIFFAHVAVQMLILSIPFYREFVIFPFNAIVVIVITLGLAAAGKKLLGRFAEYIAF